MGRSLQAYGGATATRPPVVEAKRGRFQHARTGEIFQVALDGSGTPIFTQPALPESRPRTATYLIGSGAHTRSYLWSEGDALFEAPLTWYTSRAAWGASPGYEGPDHPGLYREIRPDCLYCHADPAPHLPGSENRYAAPAPGPIGCARCHGDARAHVSTRQAGRLGTNPIVPTRLSPDRRADVCDQCHLLGAVRINREGRAFGEFLPGDALSDTVAVFVRESPGAGVGIASHGDRLRRSRCGGGQLTCTQCHSPHATHGSSRSRDASEPCRKCHGENHLKCAGDGSPECARCHMRRTQTSDIPHVAMTDHFIRTRPEVDLQSAEGSGPLRWVAHPDSAPESADERLLLGRAYAEAARAGGSNVATDRERALELLPGALEARPDSAQGWADLASMRQLAGDRAGLERAVEEAFKRAPHDVRIARATAAARIARGDGPGALAAISAGRLTDPDNFALLLAEVNARMVAGDSSAADGPLARALELRPGHSDVWLASGLTAEVRRDSTGALHAYERAARSSPLSVPARLNLFRLQALLKRWPSALSTAEAARKAIEGRGEVPQGLVERLDSARALAWAHTGKTEAAAQSAVAILTRGHREPWAAVAMGVVSFRAGQPDAALRFLDQAATWAPEDAMVWSTLATVLQGSGKPELAERARAQAERFGAAVRPAKSVRP